MGAIDRVSSAIDRFHGRGCDKAAADAARITGEVYAEFPDGVRFDITDVGDELSRGDVARAMRDRAADAAADGRDWRQHARDR